MNGAILKYATAQPLLQLEVGGATYHFFFAAPGIAPEFAFDEKTVVNVKAASGEVIRADSRITISAIKPGTSVAFSLETVSHTQLRVVVLAEAQAEQLWKVSFAGRTRLLMTFADVFEDGEQLHLRARTPENLYAAFPPHYLSPLREALHCYVARRKASSRVIRRR